MARSTKTAAFPRRATSEAVSASRDTGDLGGLYEVYLKDDCPSGSVALPVIEKPDPTGRLPRRWINITAKKGAIKVPQLVCPDCGNRWEAGQPLRPASALRFEDEIDNAEAHWQSWDCPECRAKDGNGNGKALQERGTPRGDYKAPHRTSDGMALPLDGQRTERRRYYLQHEEVLRLMTLADPAFVAEPVYTNEKDLNTGAVTKVRTGWKDGLKPLTYRARRNARAVNLAPFIVYLPMNRPSTLSGSELQRYDELAGKLAGVTEDWQLAMGEVSEAESEYRQAAEQGDVELLKAADERWKDARTVATKIDKDRTALLERIPRP